MLMEYNDPISHNIDDIHNYKNYKDIKFLKYAIKVWGRIMEMRMRGEGSITEN